MKPKPACTPKARDAAVEACQRALESRRKAAAQARQSADDAQRRREHDAAEAASPRKLQQVGVAERLKVLRLELPGLVHGLALASDSAVDWTALYRQAHARASELGLLDPEIDADLGELGLRGVEGYVRAYLRGARAVWLEWVKYEQSLLPQKETQSRRAAEAQIGEDAEQAETQRREETSPDGS